MINGFPMVIDACQFLLQRTHLQVGLINLSFQLIDYFLVYSTLKCCLNNAISVTRLLLRFLKK